MQSPIKTVQRIPAAAETPAISMFRDVSSFGSVLDVGTVVGGIPVDVVPCVGVWEASRPAMLFFFSKRSLLLSFVLLDDLLA